MLRVGSGRGDSGRDLGIIHPATLEDKMKEPKNQEESDRAILLAVVVFLVGALVSLLLNLLFARQSRPAKSRSGR
jgi:hypothetical protein